MTTATLLRSARLDGGDATVDVLVRDGRVAAIAPRLEDAVLDGIGGGAGAGDADRVDLDGRMLLPGLWDHHVHFDQHALTRHWIDLSGTDSAAAVVAAVRRRVSKAPVPRELPLVGYGYRDGLWSEAPHRRMLDEVMSDHPLVMVGGDLHQAWLNGAALERYGLDPAGDGVVRESQWHPIMVDVRTVPAHLIDQWAREAALEAASRGVVGVIEFEKADNITAWTRRAAQGTLPFRVDASIWPEYLDDAVSAGHRTGAVIEATNGRVAVGPLKVVTDGSLNSRTAACHDPYPGLEAHGEARGLLEVEPRRLEELMSVASRAGIHSAIHAIGDRANAHALDAFARTGARGAIEHAQLVSEEDFARFAILGVRASVQPVHAVDDRDVAERLWPGRTERAFAYASLLRAGAELTLGSDAPVAPLDPFVTIAAAVARTDDERPSWHPEQRIAVRDAVRASTATRSTRPRVGDRADLVVIGADALPFGGTELAAIGVSGTMVDGGWTFRSGL